MNAVIEQSSNPQQSQSIAANQTGPADPRMAETFAAQKAAFAANPYPSREVRRGNLKRLESLLKGNRDKIIAALNADFGHRSTEETRIAEISGSVIHIHYALKNLRRWMRARHRSTTMWFLPGGNRIQAQPAGVVGIMAPWNYPINLAVAPLASALAAGNRAMIKMSEYTPESSRLLREVLAQGFDESEVAIFGGAAEESAQFSALPFDHLLFTGSTGVGRRVMAAAAPNLTPLTLELGGKSPVVINHDYPLDEAAARILWGKQFNAGQTCVAPDYVLLPKGRADEFVASMSRRYTDLLPDGAASTDYTCVIDQRNDDRLSGLVADAAEKGARIVPLEERGASLAQARKFPLTLVINPDDQCRVMNEEIFGPVLPVIEVDGLEQCITRINAGDRPLALYFFGHSTRDRDHLLRNTHAGGVSVNDVLTQYLQVSQPFGGTGASGFGSYHGEEGFKAFSHMKPVFTQRGLGRFTGLKLLYPPYGPLARRLIALMGG